MKKLKFAMAIIAITVALSAFTTDGTIAPLYWYEADDITFYGFGEGAEVISDLESTRPGLDFASSPGSGYVPYLYGYPVQNSAGDPFEVIYGKPGI